MSRGDLASQSTMPKKYSWDDWRPIGMLDFGRSHLVLPNNPDAFLGAPDQSDIPAVINRGITLARGAAERLKAIGASGWYCHSLTFRFTKTNYPKLKRIEYQNPDNRPLGCNYQSAETDGMPLFEYMVKYLLDKGFPGGILIRPSYPRGNFCDQWPSALGGRYVGQVPIDRERIFDYLRPRLEWATKLGFNKFYYDSPWKEDYSTLFFEQFLKEYPDCVLFPEVVNNYNKNREWMYQYGPVWTTYNLNAAYTDKGYKCIFSVDQNKDINFRDRIKERIHHALDRQHIVCPYIWCDSNGYGYLKECLAERDDAPT